MKLIDCPAFAVHPTKPGAGPAAQTQFHATTASFCRTALDGRPLARHSPLDIERAGVPMQMTPVIAIHLSASLAALALGPVALWARRGHAAGKATRIRLHRAAGYAWTTLMLASAVSALFIHDYRLPNIGGYTPIHLFVPYTLVSLGLAFYYLAKGNITGHRKTMVSLYLGACITAGAFTLLPHRYLGQLVWGQWLGLV
jgi:uncharacterized membrane protein